MDPNKIDPQSIEVAKSEVNDFTNNLGGVSSEQSTVNAAYAKAAQAEKERQAFKNALTAAGLRTTDSLINMGGALVRTDKVTLQSINNVADVVGSLSGLLKTIPYVGKIAGMGLDALTAITKFQISEMSKAYEEFTKMSDFGVLETFEDLTEISRTAKLSFEDASAVFTKYSSSMAYFGKGIIGGTKRFQSIASTSVEISEDFQRIGMSAKDVADSQLNYISQEARYGRLKNLTDTQIVEQTKQYILMVDQLARITGTNRKELEKQLEEQSKDVQAVAGLAGLEEKTQVEITKFTSIMTSIDPEQGKAFKEAIYSSGRIMNDGTINLAQMMGNVGIDFVKWINDVRSGVISADKATEQYAHASAQWVKNPQVQMLAKQRSDTTQMTKLLLGAMKTANYAGKKMSDINADIAKQQADAVSGKDPKSRALSDSVRNMYNASIHMRIFAVSSEAASNRMLNYAQAAESLTDSMYNLIHDKSQLPLNIQARRAAANEAYQSTQYGGDINTSKKLKEKTQSDLARLTDMYGENNRTPGNLRQRQRMIRMQRTITNQVTNIEDYGKQKDQAEALRKKYESQYRAIEEVERATGQSNQPLDVWTGSTGARTGPPPGTGSPTPLSGTGTGAGAGGGGGVPGEGVKGTSGALPPRSSNILLRAIGLSEGGGSYDIAFGDRIGKNGIIYNTLYPSWTNQRVMTAAEWSKGKNLSDMTLNEVNEFQTYRNKIGNFAGLGKYGFIQGTLFGGWNGKNKTPGVVQQLGLDMNTKFDGATQDKIAEYLLKLNQNQLSGWGIPTTPEWTYMSWYIGPGGTRAVWNAIKAGQGNLSVADVYMRAGLGDPRPGNPELARTRAIDFSSVLEGRMRKGGAYDGQQPSTPKGAKIGAIFKGPSTGYLVELHGEEAVIIPNNDGSESTQFDSMFSTSKKDRKIMAKFFDMLDTKVNSMLDIANMDYITQRSALRA